MFIKYEFESEDSNNFFQTKNGQYSILAPYIQYTWEFLERDFEFRLF